MTESKNYTNSDYSFLNDMDDSPLFRFLSEKSEGRLHQIACMISWACTPEGRKTTSLGGKNASPYLAEWARFYAKNFPLEFAKICSRGGKTMQERLNNNLELKREHYASVAASLVLWNAQNPEDSNRRIENAIEGLRIWREENPVAYKNSLDAWQKSGTAASMAVEGWKIGWKIARIRYKLWQKTEDYTRWLRERSREMSEWRKDPLSDFNLRMKEAHRNSKAKKESEIENIKKATESMARKVSCPVCGREGAYRIMKRHHFDNCTFNEKLELEVIRELSNEKVYSMREIKSLFLNAGMDKIYFGKYSVLERYFKKFDPSKVTLSKYVLSEIEQSVYLDV